VDERAQKLWRLVRQDDNGNRFVMATFTSRAEAEEQRAVYEARGHKQLYTVEPSSESTQ
jgi:hypothetical protein